MKKHLTFVSLALGVSLTAACGGGGGGGGGGTSSGNGNHANVATTSGGETIHSASGQEVSVTAHQRFMQAVQSMRDHDAANNGRGDWNNSVCGQVADQFQDAAEEQQHGAFPEAWVNRALAFERCGDTSHARDALNTAIQHSQGGNNCRARAQLGVYQYRDASTRSQARATFEQAIHDDPNCVEAYTNLAMIIREESLAVANERRAQEQRAEAVGHIRQALARDDKFIPALNQLALIYLANAGGDVHSRQLTLAQLVCAQAIQLAQGNSNEMGADVRGYVADVFNTLGLVNIKLGQITTALTAFRQAFQLNPNMFEAYMNYATINLNFRGYQDASDAFQHAVQLKDGDYDAHIGLGVALRGLEHYPDAEQQYTRAQQIDANRPESYYNLGALYESYMGADIPSNERALGYFQQFVQHAGNNAQYADSVDRARRHMRNIQNVITALRAVGPQGADANANGGAGAAPAGGSGDANGGGGAAPAGGDNAGGGGAAPAGGGDSDAGAH